MMSPGYYCKEGSDTATPASTDPTAKNGQCPKVFLLNSVPFTQPYR